MNFAEKYIGKNSPEDEPSPLVNEMLKQKVPNLNAIISKYDFENVDDLYIALQEGWWEVARDEYFLNIPKSCTFARLLASKASKLVTSPGFEIRMRAEAVALWISFYQKKHLNKKRAELFNVPLCEEIAKKAYVKIRETYDFTEEQMEYFRYFICQSRREHSDPSKNRALYLYSKEKATGKTTTARAIVGVLNGCKNWGEVCYNEWESDIPTELQFSQFAQPKSCKFAAVLMDEAFAGRGTALYYKKFKKTITSEVVDVEIKHGAVFTAPCCRNYIFTSNDPISEVVDDEEERRFFEIEMNKKPKFLDNDEIFNMWSDYIVNVKDELNIYKWYLDTMQKVTGEMGVKNEDISSAFLSNDFLHVLDGEGYQVDFPRFFFKYINSMGAYDLRNSKIALLVKEVVVNIFGEPKIGKKRKYYNISEIKAKMNAREESEIVFEDGGNSEDSKDDDKLLF